MISQGGSGDKKSSEKISTQNLQFQDRDGASVLSAGE